MSSRVRNELWAVLKRLIRVCALLLVGLGATGCGPQLLFVGDPVLEATLFDREGFERSVDRAARTAGYRARIVWPRQRSLEAVDAFSVIESHSAEVVVLSPYLSLMADEIASRLPHLSFVGYYGSEGILNVTWVHFDPEPGLRDAGMLVAEWVFAGAGRRAVVLVDESDETAWEEAAWFEAGYESRAEVGLERITFSATPTREEVRNRVRSVARDEERALVLMLGAASGWALEAARDEDVKVVIRHGMMPDPPGQVLLSVVDDLAVGLAAALETDASRVEVPSVVRGR